MSQKLTFSLKWQKPLTIFCVIQYDQIFSIQPAGLLEFLWQKCFLLASGFFPLLEKGSISSEIRTSIKWKHFPKSTVDKISTGRSSSFHLGSIKSCTTFPFCHSATSPYTPCLILQGPRKLRVIPAKWI